MFLPLIKISCLFLGTEGRMYVCVCTCVFVCVYVYICAQACVRTLMNSLGIVELQKEAYVVDSSAKL